MKTRIIHSLATAILLFAFGQHVNAQLVTKHGGIEPQYGYGHPISKLLWLADNRPISYSEYAVTKYFPSGNGIIYNKSYELNGYLEETYADLQEIDGSTIFNTTEYLFATDDLGDPMWAVEPSHPDFDAEFDAFCETNGGNIITFDAAQRDEEIYLCIAEIEKGSGNLQNYFEFRLDIPADPYRSSIVTTANNIEDHGYFLTLSTSADEAYTLSIDYGINITEMQKQEYGFIGGNEPLHIHEVLPTEGEEMFFVSTPNSPRGAIIGKFNYGHACPVLKYIEPNDPSTRITDLIQERGLIVETEETARVNMYVEGYGTISTLVDAVTYSFKYFDGNKFVAALVQYDEDFTTFCHVVSYDHGDPADEVYNHNIVKDYAGRIQMRAGVSDNPAYAPGVIDDCYYSVLEADNLFDNCDAGGFEISEIDLPHIRTEASHSYSTNEYELLEVDITHNDLAHTSEEECPAGRSFETQAENQNGDASNFTTTIFPNPSSDHVFVRTAGFENARLRIFAITGELIRTRNLPGNNVFEIKDLPKGIYIFAISDELGNIENKKVLIK